MADQLEWWPWLATVKAEALPHLPPGWDLWEADWVLADLLELYNDGLNPVDAASELVWSVTN